MQILITFRFSTYKNSKIFIPDIWLRVIMVNWKFVFVEEVSILDMLGKPKKLLNHYILLFL